MMDTIPLFAKFFGFGPRDRATALAAGTFFGFFGAQPSGLTPPHYAIVPDFVANESRGPTFRKPVVMVIDGMSISAADYVPAALKDNGRVKLFGTTTSGAGGDQRHVTSDDVCKSGSEDELVRECVPGNVADAMKTLGIVAYNHTVTLGVRTNGRLIENVGVSPDVHYRIRAEDLTADFSSMWKAIIATTDPIPSP